MPRKQLMTWREKSRRWVRKFQGKQYVVSCRQLGVPENYTASLQAANEWWTKKLAELAPPKPVTITAYVRKEAPQVDLNDPKAFSRLVHSIHLHDNLPNLIAPSSRVISKHITAFLAHKQIQANAGAITVDRWGAIKSHLDTLQDWIGANAKIDGLTSATLKEFYQFLLAEPKWSSAYKISIFNDVKMFIRSLAEDDLIPLPGKLLSKDFKFGNGHKKIKYFTIQELQYLLSQATEPMKLYILLMMNCGMYQSDISDLEQNEVHWEKGTVTRKRSKTQDAVNCPTVCYKLWDETFRLLKQYRGKGDRVLVSAKGKPLKQEAIVDGKLSKTDVIQSAYRRLVKRLKIARKPLKLVRKTSANLLAGHKDYGKFAQHFLGHSPRTVADKFYLTPNQTEFDQAMAWLGEQLGV